MWKIAPGDVIHRCNVAVMDRDFPLMVIACRSGPRRKDVVGVSRLNVRVLALYMLPSGGPCLREIDIDEIDAIDYELVIRQSTCHSSTQMPARGSLKAQVS